VDGFVTLAVGDRYLQMAAAFALSARRFGYETVLMYRDADPARYRALFAETFDLAGKPTANPPVVYAARELKRYAYQASPRFTKCCFVDADSLVIRNPARMFAELARSEQIHTPAGRRVGADQAWAAPSGIPTQQAAQAMGVPKDRVVQTLNGGFLFWKRGTAAERWFDDYESLYGRLAQYFQDTLHRQCTVSDELCAGIAFALSGIELWKSNSSIGVWDAANLKLDMAREEFTCVKHHYWEGHRFGPYIAHFGGSAIGSRYRECAAFVRQGQNIDLPLFDTIQESPVRSLSQLSANAYSLSDGELIALRQFVANHGIKSVLEFGPGRSTACFLDAGCRVYSLEYEARWLAHYRGVFANRPQLTLGVFQNREPAVLPQGLPERFDMALVDSPAGEHVAGAAGCSRLNTCLAAAAHTDLILLHDVNRSTERSTVEHMRNLGWDCESLAGAPKLAALRRAGGSFARRPSTAAKSAPSYDFSHWPALPRVSCQCITYGRTSLLDEAVESFLLQDYPGWKELVILNDLPSLTLRLDHPEVKVVNLPYRMRSIGEKRNACVALCDGDVIFPWDDDDISLPHRISYSLQQMTNHRYFKADRMWTWRAGGVHPEPKMALAHAMGCWSRALFDEVGGYPHMQSGQDAALEKLFEGRGRTVEEMPPERLYYLYRFLETASYHLSAFGYGRGFEEAARYVERRGIHGTYQIKPAWAHDYLTLVAKALARLAATPAVS
jgi:hypothetical protein